MNNKTFTDYCAKEWDDKGRLWITAATDGLDRHGERLSVAGMETATYLQKNPVILWAHDSSSLPIGKTVAMDRSQPGKMDVAIEFADTEEAKTVKRLYEGGFLNSFSVGFIPLEYEMEGEVPVIKTSELLEISAVPIPANPEAIVRALDGAPEYIMKSFSLVGESQENEGEEMSEEQKKEIEAGVIKRLADLRAAFPADADFAMKAFEASQTVEQAKAQYADVLAKKLEEADAKIKSLEEELVKAKAAKVEEGAAQGVDHQAAPEQKKEKTYLELADEIQAAKKCKRVDALREARAQNQEAYDAYVKGE